MRPSFLDLSDEEIVDGLLHEIATGTDSNNVSRIYSALKDAEIPLGVNLCDVVVASISHAVGMITYMIEEGIGETEATEDPVVKMRMEKWARLIIERLSTETARGFTYLNID